MLIPIPAEAEDKLGASALRVLFHLLCRDPIIRPSFREIGDHCRMNPETVRDALEEIDAAGLLPDQWKLARSLTPEEAEELLRRRAKGHQRCAWCNQPSFSLHRHHHPIPKEQGGNQTVDICGTCHADFHWMTR